MTLPSWLPPTRGSTRTLALLPLGLASGSWTSLVGWDMPAPSVPHNSCCHISTNPNHKLRLWYITPTHFLSTPVVTSWTRRRLVGLDRTTRTVEGSDTRLCRETMGCFRTLLCRRRWGRRRRIELIIG